MLHGRAEVRLQQEPLVGLLRVVPAEDAECLAHAADALLQVRLGLHVVGMALLPDAVHLGLRLCQGRQLAFHLLHLPLQLPGPRHGLVDLRREPRGVVAELALLGLCFAHLLIAISLLRCRFFGLLLQLLDHVLDEALDLAEGVAAEAGDGRHAAGELREGRRVLRAGEALHQGQGLGPGRVPGRDLKQGCTTAGRLAQDPGGIAEDLQLLLPGLERDLVIHGRLHAILGRQIALFDHLLKLLGRAREVALCSCLCFLGAGLGRLFLGHVLLARSNLRLEGLLQHVEVVPRISLGLPERGELPFRLLLQVLDHVQDARAARLGGRRSWCAQVVVLVLVLRVAASLNQTHQLIAVCAREGRSVSRCGQRLQHAGHVADVRLQQGGGVLLRLALEDAEGPGEGVDGVQELLLAHGEVGSLLLADLGRLRQVRLGGGGRRHELLDLDARGLNVAVELIDLGLQLFLLRGC
mmetsp:Transcript_70/g.206  ORF Transcript_70/g.206 Transcript_70/m.206 type:complete len:467 (-) Transcript_70:296-1696(-)